MSIFRKPYLHIHGIEIEKKATPLELFYDLVFVAAFIQLGNGLAENLKPIGAIMFFFVFALLWLIWTGYTFFNNRFTIDDGPQRVMVFFQMIGIGLLAVSSSSIYQGNTLGFSLAYTICQLLLSGMLFRAWLQVDDGRPFAKYWGYVYLLGSLVWLISAFTHGTTTFILWSIGALIVILSPLTKKAVKIATDFPPDWEHINERYGLLTLIVLGESFVKVLSGISTAGGGLELAFQATILIAITCSVWWVYFDQIFEKRILLAKSSGVIWMYAHLFLQGSIVALGVAIKKGLMISWENPVPLKYGMILCLSSCLVLVSISVIETFSESSHRKVSPHVKSFFRLSSAAIFLGLIFISEKITGTIFLSLLVAVWVMQILFDLVTAGMELSSTEMEYIKADYAKHPERLENMKGKNVFRRVARKGKLAAGNDSIFSLLMRLNLWQFFGVLTAVYLLVVCFFAVLYTMDLNGISGATSFMDALYFSVQTISTIGYGSLSPQSDFVNMVVLIQSGLGICGVAATTGLVYARFSLPKAGVVFSENMLITSHNGQRALIFRVGNAKEGDLISAEISVSALIDEHMEDGGHLRRIHDLKLVRNVSPFFALSWTVIHEIDENSPFAKENWREHIQNLSVVLKAHDGTYSGTIYKRKEFFIEDVLEGRRFVDMLELLPNGTMVIDFDKIDLTESITQPKSN